LLTFILKKKEWSNFIVPLFKIKNSKVYKKPCSVALAL